MNIPLVLTVASTGPGVQPGWAETYLHPTGTVVLAVLLVLACLAAWTANLVALPGNWIAVGLLALYAWAGPGQGRAAVGVAAVAAAAIAALLGEAIEFAAGALGAQRAGASRRATVWAMVGSMAGALVGAVVGLPIPVVGSVLAAILFGGIGATAGAVYGEKSSGTPWRNTLTIGHAAFWGRTLGTLGKVICGLAIVIIAAAAVLI